MIEGVYEKILIQLNQTNSSVIFKTLKTTKTKTKALVDLGLASYEIVQSGKKKRTTYNALKITKKGKIYLAAMQSPTNTLLPEIDNLNTNLQNIFELQENIQTTYDATQQKLKELQTNVQTVATEIQRITEKVGVEGELQLFKLEEVVSKHTGRVSRVANVKDVLDDLQNITNIKRGLLKQQIIAFYEQGHIELISGQGSEHIKLDSGESFSFIRRKR